jgi:hypothetical protein
LKLLLLLLLMALLPCNAAAAATPHSVAAVNTPHRAAAAPADYTLAAVVYFFLSPTCSPLSVNVSGCCSRNALNLVDRPSGRFTCSDQADEASTDAVSDDVGCRFRQGFGCFTQGGGGEVLQQEILELGRHTLRTLHLQWVAEEPTAVYNVYSQSH